MATNELSNPVFQDADKARQWLEAALWPEGPVCGHCGTLGKATALPTRPSWYQCNACRKQFSVTVGTLFERSHIPLNKWLMAAFLLCASKKGISAHQMHRMIGVSYKSTWFMMHRLREAMRDGSFPGPLGGEGKVVEADETYYGPKATRHGRKPRRGYQAGSKQKVVALVERGGSARSFHVENVDSKTVRTLLFTNASRQSRLMTDEAGIYPSIGLHFADHKSVMHSAGEYVRGDVHTNTIEGFFSIFKRGMKGVYQHCGEQHLQRYLAEFDFRYSNRSALGVDDAQRAAKALKGIQGKRLTYRRAGERAYGQA